MSDKDDKIIAEVEEVLENNKKSSDDVLQSIEVKLNRIEVMLVEIIAHNEAQCEFMNDLNDYMFEEDCDDCKCKDVSDSLIN